MISTRVKKNISYADLLRPALSRKGTKSVTTLLNSNGQPLRRNMSQTHSLLVIDKDSLLAAQKKKRLLLLKRINKKNNPDSAKKNPRP